VDSVFTFLKDGCNTEGTNQINRIHHDNFLQNLCDMMHDVMQHCEYLENTVKDIPKSNFRKIVPVMANMNYLSLDSGEDRNLLFDDNIIALRKKSQIKEFGNQSDKILQSRALKRSNYPHANPKWKRSRPEVNYFHSLPQKQVYETLPTVFRLLGSEVKCQVKNLGGNHRLLQLRIGRTLSVFIILRGLNIEKVFARGLFEDDPTEVDLYSESQYEAMQMITTHASAAVLFYTNRSIVTNRHYPDHLIGFLHWLKSYSNLFTASCKRCNRYLHKGIPPTWRDFHNFTPYHFECRH
jgi:hypothetical protein